MAARLLGLDRAAVILLAHPSDMQNQAPVLSDDQLVEQAGGDLELQAIAVADLAALGSIDIGVRLSEIAHLLNRAVG